MSKSTKKFIAWLLVSVVVLAGVFGALWHFTDVFKPSAEPPTEETPGDNDTPESNVLSIMPRSLEASTAESNTVELKAVISPSIASQPVTWAMAWENSISDWASGKTLNDYLEIVVSEDTLTANVNCLQSFGEPIIVTCALKADATIKATCKVDYAQKIEKVNVDIPVYRYTPQYLENGYIRYILNDDINYYDIEDDDPTVSKPSEGIYDFAPLEIILKSEATVNFINDISIEYKLVWTDDFTQALANKGVIFNNVNRYEGEGAWRFMLSREVIYANLSINHLDGAEVGEELCDETLLEFSRAGKPIYEIVATITDGADFTTTRTCKVCITESSLLRATDVTLSQDNIVF